MTEQVTWKTFHEHVDNFLPEDDKYSEWLRQELQKGSLTYVPPLPPSTSTSSSSDTNTLQQGTAAWFQARSTRLTGSNIAAAVGLSPFATPHSLWEKITGRLGDQVSTSSSETQHGIDNEENVVQLYTRVTSRHVVETGFWVHKKSTWLGASPDGLVGDDGVLEIKCPVHKVHDKVPAYYMPQLQAEMACTNRDWVDFCSWYHGKKEVSNETDAPHFRVFRVKRSPEYWKWLMIRMKKFWSCVLLDISPRGIEELSTPPKSAPPHVVDDDMIVNILLDKKGE